LAANRHLEAMRCHEFDVKLACKGVVHGCGERKYELKRLGYDLDGIAARVAEICKIEIDDIFIIGKQQKRVKARSLLCFWAVRELRISLTELARRLGISVPGVGYSVERGEIIARKNDYQLIQQIS